MRKGSGINLFQFIFVYKELVTIKMFSGCFLEAEPQSLNPQVTAVARKKSLLTARNREQDQVYKEEPSCRMGKREGKERNRMERIKERERETNMQT